MTKLTKFTVVGPLTKANELCHIHIAGCQDLRNLRVYRGQEKSTVEAEGAIEAALKTVLDTDLGWTVADIRVFPCCGAAEVSGWETAVKAAKADPAPAPEVETAPIAKETEMLTVETGEADVVDLSDVTAEEPAPEVEVNQDPGQEAPSEGVDEMTVKKIRAGKGGKPVVAGFTPAPKPGKTAKAPAKKMTPAESLALSAKLGAQTKKMSGGKPAPKTAKAVKAPATPKAPKAPKAEKAPRAPKAPRLELTSRQRAVLIEDAKNAGLKADVTAGKQVTMTAGSLADLKAFAGLSGDATRQRVYTGLLARAEEFVKVNGLTA